MGGTINESGILKTKAEMKYDSTDTPVNHIRKWKQTLKTNMRNTGTPLIWFDFSARKLLYYYDKNFKENFYFAAFLSQWLFSFYKRFQVIDKGSNGYHEFKSFKKERNQVYFSIKYLNIN